MQVIYHAKIVDIMWFQGGFSAFLLSNTVQKF